MRAGFTSRIALLLCVLLCGTARAQGPPPPPAPNYGTPNLSSSNSAPPVMPAPAAWPPTETLPSGPPPQTLTQSQPTYFPPTNPQAFAAENVPPMAPYPGGNPYGSVITDATPVHPAYREGPSRGLVLFYDLDSWRGIGDRGSRFARPGNNEGGSGGFNFATRLGTVTDLTTLSFQVGGSYGVYDINGRPFNAAALNWTEPQQQVFLTMGFFKRSDQRSDWSYGFVHDWMFNQAWGAYAVNPTLGQWRGQLGYALDRWNEIGVWGTLRDKGDSNLDWFGNSVHTRPLDQVNLFWHHNWEYGGDSWIWIGLPEGNRLSQFAGGSLGDFLIGGSYVAPLNDYVSLFANTQYMHPSSSPGPAAYGEASWYLAIGIQYTIGGGARSKDVNGNAWLPLLPVANNGNFLVDSVRTF